MRRLLRILHVVATILAVVVSVAIVTGLAVESSWFKQWLRGYIVRAANERLNGTLSIGRLSGNLYSHVEVDNVKVVMNGLPVITIDKVSATYNIRDMISKGIVIDRVDVTHPVVAMHREDGGWDLGHFIKGKQANEPETERRPIRIQQITIDGGTFSMRRPGQDTIMLESIVAVQRQQQHAVDVAAGGVVLEVRRLRSRRHGDEEQLQPGGRDLCMRGVQQGEEVRLGEQAILGLGDEECDGVAASGHERARRMVWRIGRLACRLQHGLARVLAHVRCAAQDTARRRARDAGARRDDLEGWRPVRTSVLRHVRTSCDHGYAGSVMGALSRERHHR